MNLYSCFAHVCRCRVGSQSPLNVLMGPQRPHSAATEPVTLQALTKSLFPKVRPGTLKALTKSLFPKVRPVTLQALTKSLFPKVGLA